MRKIKKLLVGVCTTAFCLSAMAIPVCAEGKDYYDRPGSYEYVLSSYTEPAPYGRDLFYFSDDTKEDKRQSNLINEQCRVTLDNVDSWYEDTAIIKEAKKAIKKGKKVYNLRYLAEFGQFMYFIDDSNVLNYGIVIMDKDETPYHYSHSRIICKCSEKDYEQVFYTDKGREMNEDEYEYSAVNTINVDCSYNPTSNILTIDVDAY